MDRVIRSGPAEKSGRGRVDGLLKVTGQMPYAADMVVENCLHVAALRSPHPHARIVSIDASRALAIPGVRCVLTGADVPTIRTGRGMRDTPILAVDRCRFVGEMVAAVAADDPETARMAAGLIDVDYAPLPAVLDLMAALEPDAVVLHEQPWAYALAERGPEDLPNVVARNTFRNGGDIDDAFARSAMVVEHTFRTPKVHQAYIEPHCCVVRYVPPAGAEIWSVNKTPHPLREQLAGTFDLPPDSIRVHVMAVGGDFGGKGAPMDIPVCLELSRRTGRPVRMQRRYTEELLAGDPAPDTITYVRVGVDHEGHIQAYWLRSYINAGAYGGYTPFARALVLAASSYRLPVTDIQTIRVYTNQVPSGQMRAPGCMQMTFAVECMMDVVASRLGMDPIEFRRRNLLASGEPTHAGQRWPEHRGIETLNLAESLASRQPEPTPGRLRYGRGVALFDRPTHSAARTSVRLQMLDDGQVDVELTIPETGTGSHTVMHVVLAEALGVPREAIGLRTVSTDELPFAVAVGGQRVGVSQIEMAHTAAQVLKQRIVEEAAAMWGVPVDLVEYAAGEVQCSGLGARVTLQQLLERRGTLDVQAQVIEEDIPHQAVTNYCVQIAEVAVDTETGQVWLLKLVSAHDVAEIVAPQAHQGQIEGGAVMGMGFALSEDLGVVDGQVGALNWGDYKVPTIEDAPPLQVGLLRGGIGVGARNVKSIGEMSNVPTAAAIANAVSDALGVRMESLPLTAEKVLRAVQQSAG